MTPSSRFKGLVQKEDLGVRLPFAVVVVVVVVAVAVGVIDVDVEVFRTRSQQLLFNVRWPTFSPSSLAMYSSSQASFRHSNALKHFGGAYATAKTVLALFSPSSIAFPLGPHMSILHRLQSFAA